MDKAIVTKTFSPKNYKDANLLQKACVVLKQLTNNAYFPDIQAELDEFEVKIENYRRALANLNEGGRLTTLIKRDSRLELESSLKELADYVQQTSKGAENIIFSAGFDTHKKPSRVGGLDRPTRVMLKMGSNRGTVWLSCDVVDRALFYVFEYCLAPLTADSVWIQLSASKRKILIEGLISGQEYCFRVAAARTHPSRNWSDPIKSHVI